ncbi:MAG: glycosyltransferase family 2 protein [Pseudomonadota bacterium]
MNNSPSPELSVVVPFFNEEDCLVPVVRELLAVMNRDFPKSWELLLVDDGSSDRTPELLDGFSDQDPQIRAVHLMPNSGQSAAMEAGFSLARGRFIAVLDGDGQNDPADILLLLKAIEKTGVDMMCGIRRNRADSLVRKVSSRIANRIRSAILKDNITDVGCSIRVFRRQCLMKVPFFRNAHRFFPALMIRAGYTVDEMPVNHRPRIQGTSKYGLGINSRLWVGIADLAGVYWLTRRKLIYEIRENRRNGPSIQD